MPVLAEGKTRTAWLWTFIARDESDLELIGYRYSPSRSGETPVLVLGGTKGFLIPDGYTAYNKVTTPTGRERVGCIAHLRRRFFDALSSAPQARRPPDLILEVYKVEQIAADQGIVGTPKHLVLRQEKSRQVMQDLRSWLEAEQPKHLPKGPLGEAIGYALNQWGLLIRFLDDARLPVDNNGSERALRPVALGRKNYLFVGHDQAGQNIAGLYSLIATCEANSTNPFEYLADVLPRLSTHTASRHRRTPPPPVDARACEQLLTPVALFGRLASGSDRSLDKRTRGHAREVVQPSPESSAARGPRLDVDSVDAHRRRPWKCKPLCLCRRRNGDSLKARVWSQRPQHLAHEIDCLLPVAAARTHQDLNRDRHEPEPSSPPPVQPRRRSSTRSFPKNAACQLRQMGTDRCLSRYVPNGDMVSLIACTPLSGRGRTWNRHEGRPEPPRVTARSRRAARTGTPPSPSSPR